MNYKPISAVWEITMGCNLRCKHCGSSCENPLEGELTTEEALRLCEDLGRLGFEWITLSGGEPTTRKDWHLIAEGLKRNGIKPTMITNGWLFDENILDKALQAGVRTLAFSIDGLEETHDFIRRPGSYQRIMNAFELMKQKNARISAAITTINNRNIGELRQLREVLIEKGVCAWQLQYGLPMGNMAVNNELTIEPCRVNEIIDFAYETMKEGRIYITLSDCLGYYSMKDHELRNQRAGDRTFMWQGCTAGRYSLGILHNGDILGCTSIRNREFIEGNIRNTSIKEIWENPDSFKWNRTLRKEKLEGFCSKCQYGSYCLGGCSNTRLTMNGTLYKENKYCTYHLAVDKAKAEFAQIESTGELVALAKQYLAEGNYQLTELLLSRAFIKGHETLELLKLYGFVCFSLQNYEDARAANEKALREAPQDAYANKGMGLSLCRLGKINEGIEYLRKAVALSSEDFMDPYHDLAIILAENGRKEEALELLEEGRSKSEAFIEKSRQLYEQLKTA